MRETLAPTWQTDAMKIYVNRIPDEGLREDVSYDPGVLDAQRDDVRLVTPIAVSSFVVKTEGELVVQADIRARAQMSCARCLEAFEIPLQAAATLSYAVAPTDVIDITDDIRQEIMLTYPMVPICRPECRGLCTTCGQDLNLGTCEHQQGD